MSYSVIDPMKFAAIEWPDVTFYKQQQEIAYSVLDNRETIVVAANQMGKDFVAGFIILWFFISREPCRIVTTSAKDDHLRVLWGEIGKFIQTAKHPLEYSKGGNLIFNQRELKKVVNGVESKNSYCRGMVASSDKIAAMQGHHATPESDDIKRMEKYFQTYHPKQWEERLNEWLLIPRTLFVSDESSSVPHEYYEMADTWAKRMLIFGNAWPCNNFFKYGVKGNPETRDPGGDLEWA